MQMSMFLSEEPPASPSALPGCERAWLTRAATSCSPILPSLTAIAPAGSSGRMSLASCPVAADGILVPSSGVWGNSGMGSPGECLTLNMSEHAASPSLSRSDAAVCSLSDILETGDVPQRFLLTAKACAGILRRAEKRGKQLPPQLAHALQAVADSGQISTVTGD